MSWKEDAIVCPSEIAQSDLGAEAYLIDAATEGEMAPPRLRKNKERHARELRELGTQLLTIADQVEDAPAPPSGYSAVAARPASLHNGQASLVDIAKAVARTRSRRSKVFSAELFGEPAWDILLDLFIQHAEGRIVPTTSACLASGVPLTTGLRCLGSLEQHGLVIREKGTRDHRINQVRLSAKGADCVRQCLSMLWDDLG